MKINLYCITKETKQEEWAQEYQKMCRSFGSELNIFNIFTPAIIKAHKGSITEAKLSYTKALQPYLNQQAKNIALHPDGKMHDSFGFAKLLDTQVINFFIGGAHGFEDGFLSTVQSLSLSALTFGHKIAKLVLCEQIYRALSIINNHPYHK